MRIQHQRARDDWREQGRESALAAGVGSFETVDTKRIIRGTGRAMRSSYKLISDRGRENRRGSIIGDVVAASRKGLGGPWDQTKRLTGSSAREQTEIKSQEAAVTIFKEVSEGIKLSYWIHHSGVFIKSWNQT